MELDAVAEELYGLRPEEFVAARDRFAAQARSSGDRSLAREIAALRRPSLAAWVSNLLVRRRSAEVRPLLALGEELRRAHRELDGSQLRRLARRQSEVIGALGRQARRLAAEAGHPVGEGVQREVEETLHAVLADPEAAREWGAGRLVKPLSAAIGFPAADEAAVARRPTPPASRADPSVREAEPSGPEEDEERRRRLAEARERAREAERELRARRGEATAAEAEEEEAARRAAGAEERLARLRAELQRAQEEQRQARTEERDTRDRARKAAQAVREAERRARDAAARAEDVASGND
ncbi:hypothetical protein AQJ66_28925 [Streptomyces bungoensis]|uniref:Uncharacterized protein n=1 Tax=Streptomyces bungoensis TaxID=285568 RepID=A0A101SSH4_9ACTN|nr:hypothetical protein [Streptomyces bungoensis]KUN79342.1 hypothetical protein AQJ66_28925 [Streptomyces bungoensis]